MTPMDGRGPHGAPTPRIPGTYVFDSADNRRGRALNRLCGSLKEAANRASFTADQGAYCDAYGLTADQRTRRPGPGLDPDPGERWPCAVVPLLGDVIQYPQPTAARCLALGRALGEAIRSYPEGLKVAVFGTGGMSHQLAGARAGLINQDFDAMFLDAIEHDPEKLASLTREEYIREVGSEGIELIMWLVTRGALGPRIRRVFDTYHVPASNTASGMALFENLSG